MIRRTALKYNIPYATTVAGGMAICKAIAALKKKQLSVKTVQEYNQ
jgi:carbamoyl-phosphate synthase large subunit